MTNIIPTDTQLKQALTKMLPEVVRFDEQTKNPEYSLHWREYMHAVLDTELLHLCWLVEETLEVDQWNDYIGYVMADTHSVFTYKHLLHATWQQRVIALAKVKGIGIV